MASSTQAKQSCPIFAFKYAKQLFMKKGIVLTNLLLLFAISQICAHNTQTDTVKSPFKWERFSVNFGGFLSGLSSDINLGSKQLGVGVSINLENALGLETNSTVLRSEVDYVWGKSLRHSSRFTYYGFYRSAEKVLTEDLEIGDEIYYSGTKLTSKFNLEIFKFDYAYALFMDERIKLNATLGLFFLPISFSTSADENSQTAFSVTAPLPAIGFRTYYAVTPKFYIIQNLELFYMSVGSFTGSMTDLSLKAEYMPWNHFGLGAGLNSYRLEITKTGPDTYLDFEGTIQTGYTGLMFYVKYFF